MTCTAISSPTRRAAAAPASVAARTAATSPRTRAVTYPEPIFSQPTSVTLAAFTIASEASIIATRPRVSIIPSASPILHPPPNRLSPSPDSASSITTLKNLSPLSTRAVFLYRFVHQRFKLAPRQRDPLRRRTIRRYRTVRAHRRRRLRAVAQPRREQFFHIFAGKQDLFA